MLPIKSILWAPSNSAHWNHLHVEGDPRFTGTPPQNNPGMSDSVWTIWVALAERFGRPAYFLDGDADSADWTHMGWYNRRKIAGSTSWSQHSWSNALDIGPYYGVAQQQRFYDFLTGNEPTPEEPVMSLPINADSHKEEVRHVQEMLGQRATGDWDFQAAVSALAQRSGTGDPKGKDGTHINGRMYTQLLQEFIGRNSSGGAHDHDGRYVKNVSVER